MRSVRFCKQKDLFRCGPISVLNLMKLRGHKVSEAKNLYKLSKLFKSTKEIGTDRAHFTKCLKKMKGKVGKFKHILVPTYRDIISALRQEKIIIVSIAYHSELVANDWNSRDIDYETPVSGHFALIFRDANGWDIGVNLFRHETLVYLNENIIQEHILPRYSFGKSKTWAYPQAWIFDYE